MHCNIQYSDVDPPPQMCIRVDLDPEKSGEQNLFYIFLHNMVRSKYCWESYKLFFIKSLHFGYFCVSGSTHNLALSRTVLRFTLNTATSLWIRKILNIRFCELGWDWAVTVSLAQLTLSDLLLSRSLAQLESESPVFTETAYTTVGRSGFLFYIWKLFWLLSDWYRKKTVGPQSCGAVSCMSLLVRLMCTVK